MADPSYLSKNIENFIALALVPSLVHTNNEMYQIAAPFEGLINDIIPIKRLFFFNDFIHDVLVFFVESFPDINNEIYDQNNGFYPTHYTD